MIEHYNLWALSCKASSMGPWAFNRYAAKRGIPLEVTHLVTTGALPRLAH